MVWCLALADKLRDEQKWEAIFAMNRNPVGSDPVKKAGYAIE